MCHWWTLLQTDCHSINTTIKIQSIPITEKVPSWLFVLNSIIFYPQCLVTNNLFSFSILLSFSVFHLNGIIQYVFFGIMPLRSIHTVSCINSSFILMAKKPLAYSHMAILQFAYIVTEMDLCLDPNIDYYE